MHPTATRLIAFFGINAAFLVLLAIPYLTIQ